MSAKADKKHVSHAGSLIGAGTVVSGDIFFSGGLRIDGEVRGNVRSAGGQSGTFVIGERGRVDGDIEVARLIINGSVTGRVDASEFLKLQSKAHVNCDIDYATAEIHSGAVIQGRPLQRQCTDRIEEALEQKVV